MLLICPGSMESHLHNEPHASQFSSHRPCHPHDVCKVNLCPSGRAAQHSTAMTRGEILRSFTCQKVMVECHFRGVNRPQLNNTYFNIILFWWLCGARWCWSASYKKMWYTTKSTPSSTTGGSTIRSLGWPSRALQMLVPLIGASAGPSRTLSKVGFYLYAGVEQVVLAFTRFKKKKKAADLLGSAHATISRVYRECSEPREKWTAFAF